MAMRHMRALIASFSIVLGSAVAGAGCQDCNTSATEAVNFDQGITTADRLHYESSPSTGEWLHFPAGRAYDLKHNLRPGSYDVHSYVTFPDSHGQGNNPSNFAEAAGNQVIFEPEKAEPGTIRVRNDTCAEFYVRVVADVILDAGLAGAGGMSGGPGTSGAAGTSGAGN
jgi:hypothetical protein